MPHSTPPQSLPLSPNAWAPPNLLSLYTSLSQWALSPDTPRTATFDFDNTCIFNDIGELVLRHQLEHLAFTLSPLDLQSTLPNTIYNTHSLLSGVSLPSAHAALLSLYTSITSSPSPPSPPSLLAFKSLFGWYYDQLLSTPSIGARYAYSWSARLLSGFTHQDISRLLSDVIASHINAPIQEQTWTSYSVELDREVSTTFVQGLRAQPEIIDLMHALRAVGVRVYIVSASPQAVVQQAASQLGYPVDPEHVFGMRVELDGDRLTSKMVDANIQPMTYREGKKQVIERFLTTPPVLVAGDSMTDYEMLVGFPQTEVILLINRNREDPPMRTLYAEAITPQAGRRVILQGRDERLGAFIPSHETAELADLSPRPVPLP
jgi:phosphoglycolate phosphatase-like HAD superfamily hydrolase